MNASFTGTPAYGITTTLIEDSIGEVLDHLLVSYQFDCVYPVGIDKHKAVRHEWRIPEKTLILMAFFGGAVGALFGMLFFHRKMISARL